MASEKKSSLEQGKPLKVLVIGAGIIGLSSAVTIQEHFKAHVESTPAKGVFDLQWYLKECLKATLMREKLEKISGIAIEVTIIADRIPPKTISYVDGAIWGPRSLPTDKEDAIKYVFLCCAFLKPKI